MKNISLSEKLILYFLSLGIGAIVIISVFAFISTKNALVSRTFDQLISLRTVKKNQIELFFNDRVRDLTFLAATEETRKVEGLLNSGRSDTALFSSYLEKYQNLSTYFSDIYLVGSNDVVISGNLESMLIKEGDLHHFPLHGLIPESKFTGGKPFIVDMQRINLEDEPFLIIGCVIPPKDKESQSEGILALRIQVKAINDIMLNENPESGLGKTGETYLIGEDFLMRSSSRLVANSILNTKVKTAAAMKGFEGGEGFMITNDYRNTPVLSTFAKPTIPGLNWLLLSEIDRDEAMVPIYRMRNSILFLSIFISLTFFIFVFLIARRITRPIIHLKDAAVQVGEGKYDLQLPVETNDEIGSLTVAFNTMTTQINEKTKELRYERLERIRSVIDGEESERQRLSRELHDGIGQSLVALKLRLESLMYIEEGKIKENISVLKDQFNGMVDEIRRISNNLMPSVLEVFGITIALKNLCTSTSEHSGIQVTFASQGSLETVHTKLKTYIYRIAQEALTNIVKHSAASKVSLTLVKDEEHLTLKIEDNGKGFILEEAALQRGNGLYNMRERVTLLHGKFEIRSSLNKGTQINVLLPIF